MLYFTLFYFILLISSISASPSIWNIFMLKTNNILTVVFFLQGLTQARSSRSGGQVPQGKFSNCYSILGFYIEKVLLVQIYSQQGKKRRKKIYIQNEQLSKSNVYYIIKRDRITKKTKFLPHVRVYYNFFKRLTIKYLWLPSQVHKYKGMTKVETALVYLINFFVLLIF